MTWFDFNCAVSGYFNEQREELERTRILAWTVYCGYADPKKRPSSINVWWPLEDGRVPLKDIALDDGEINRIEEAFNSLSLTLKSQVKK